MPWASWWSWGGGSVSHERDTSVERCLHLLATEKKEITPKGDTTPKFDTISTMIVNFRLFLLFIFLYSVMYDSGSVPRRAIFTPRDISPEPTDATLKPSGSGTHKDSQGQVLALSVR